MANIKIAEILREHAVSVNEHYISRYLKFINDCRGIDFSNIYTEKHHVIPKSFNGEDNHVNLLPIGARHHLIAHVLLAKATSSPKMIKALHRMVHGVSSSSKRKYKISSRLYAYLREEHAKVVSAYSKGTVVARHMSGEVRRIPKKLFDYYNGILYTAIATGRKDSIETCKKKSIAAQRPRQVKQGTKIRSTSASLYSYATPKGFCQTSKELLALYPTFNKNTLTLINNDYIITGKFASIHNEFKDSKGMSLIEIGITRINRKEYYEQD